MNVRTMQEKRGWAFWVGAAILKPTFLLTTKPDWRGGDKLPESGGYLVVLNHLSHIDPLTAAHFLYNHGRLPRYLAKSGLFKNKILGGFLTQAGQIPVERLTPNAVGAYSAAVAAIGEGKVIVVYPEGTLTRDPDQWPMSGKTGAARIALATGCPVIPIGQWGAQDLLAAYAKKPNVLPPRKRVILSVGDPVDLDDLRAQEQTPDVVAEATARIMASITGLVEEIRGEQAPVERFDMRKARVKEMGNPNRQERRR